MIHSLLHLKHYFCLMKTSIVIFFLLSPITINAQLVDFNHFNNKLLDSLVFQALNVDDHFILSDIVQKKIMRKNYQFIKRNGAEHNPRWPLNRDSVNFADDRFKTFKGKFETAIYTELTSKYPDSEFLKVKRSSNPSVYAILGYEELLSSQSFSNADKITYQDIANRIYTEWKGSDLMNKNLNFDYHYFVGVTSYFNKNDKKLLISFVILK